MRNSVPLILLAGFLLSSQSVLAADDPSITGDLRTDIQASMQSHIDR